MLGVWHRIAHCRIQGPDPGASVGVRLLTAEEPLALPSLLTNLPTHGSASVQQHRKRLKLAEQHYAVRRASWIPVAPKGGPG